MLRRTSGFTPLDNVPRCAARFGGSIRARSIIRRASSLKGFSLTEVVVVTAIVSLAVLAIGTYSVELLRQNRALQGQLDASRVHRRLFAQFSRELRTASVSSLGGYPIESATATNFVFFANIDSDAYKERVRYSLNLANNLERGVTKPSGGPPVVYNLASETVTTVADNVRNTDIFTYYDSTYTGASAPLTFPVSVSTIRAVRLILTVDDDLNRPPSAQTVETVVAIRNLKNN